MRAIRFSTAFLALICGTATALLLPSRAQADSASDPVAMEWQSTMQQLELLSADIAPGLGVSNTTQQLMAAAVRKYGEFAEKHHWARPTGLAIGVSGEAALYLGAQGGFELFMVIEPNGKLAIAGYPFFSGHGGVGGFLNAGVYVNLTFNLDKLGDNVGYALGLSGDLAFASGLSIEASVGVDETDLKFVTPMVQAIRKLKGDALWQAIGDEVIRGDHPFYLGGAVGAGVGAYGSAYFGYWWKVCEATIDLNPTTLRAFFGHFGTFMGQCKTGMKNAALRELHDQLDVYDAVYSGLDAYANHNPSGLGPTPEQAAYELARQRALQAGKMIWGKDYELPPNWTPDMVWDGHTYPKE